MSEDRSGEDLEFGWPREIGDEELAQLLAWAELRGIQRDRLQIEIEAKSASCAGSAFFYVDGEGQLVFIYDFGLEELLHFPDGTGAAAIPAVSTLLLSRAHQIYGPDLAGYARTYRAIASGPGGETSAKRIDCSVQLFVKNTGK